MKTRPPSLSPERFGELTELTEDNGTRMYVLWCYLHQEPDGFIDYRPHEIAESLGFRSGSTGRKFIARLKDAHFLRDAERGEGRKDRRTGFEFYMDSNGKRRW